MMTMMRFVVNYSPEIAEATMNMMQNSTMVTMFEMSNNNLFVQCYRIYFILIKIDNFLNNFEGSKIHIARFYDGFFLRQSLAPRDEHARLRTRGNHGDNDMLHQLDSDGDQSRVRGGYN